jgi:hypothetical protein
LPAYTLVGVVIDHGVMLVADAAEASRQLRERHGLGSERGPYHSFAGTRSHCVPLEPPAYLEFLTIERRDVAEQTDVGRRVLAAEQAGSGLLAWAVRVDDLEAVSRRLGVDIVDHTVPHGDGTLRGWRSITGPPHLPFFIDYPNNGDRVGRWQAMYDRVGHTCAPDGFTELTVSGSKAELGDWLGPHTLPLRVTGGVPGLRAARIATANGEVVIRA